MRKRPLKLPLSPPFSSVHWVNHHGGKMKREAQPEHAQLEDSRLSLNSFKRMPFGDKITRWSWDWIAAKVDEIARKVNKGSLLYSSDPVFCYVGVFEDCGEVGTDNMEHQLLLMQFQLTIAYSVNLTWKSYNSSYTVYLKIVSLLRLSEKPSIFGGKTPVINWNTCMNINML